MQIFFRRGWQLLLSLVIVSVALPVSSLATTLRIKGSDTLGSKLIPQLTEAYRRQHLTTSSPVEFAISAEGTATGIAAILENDADIGLLSRPLNRDEMEAASRNSLELTLHVIARDGLTVVVNEKNAIASLTRSQVERLFTGDVKNWAAYTEAIGPVSVYTRNTASGSYHIFQTMALQDRLYSIDAQKMAGNEQIAEEVANNPYGIGMIGLAYSKAPGVRVVPIEHRTPYDSDYPYARSFYILTNTNSEKQDVIQSFIDFCLSEEGQRIVNQVGFQPADATSIQSIQSAETGTRR